MSYCIRLMFHVLNYFIGFSVAMFYYLYGFVIHRHCLFAHRHEVEEILHEDDFKHHNYSNRSTRFIL